MVASPLVTVMVKDTIAVESMDFSDNRVFGVLLHTMQGSILGMIAYI